MKKKQHLVALFVSAVVVLPAHDIAAQGCVAIRQMGGCGSTPTTSLSQKGQWQAAINYRYFRSFRHFRGDHEEKARVENGTEVINIAHAFDVNLAYSLNDRLSFSASLPVLFNDRTSLYEHYGNSLSANPEQKRFGTSSSGIGDLRLAASYWLFDPQQYSRHNIALGLGIKLPTGNANVQDNFHRRRATDGADSVFLRTVDQSIQLGDGGVGFTLEAQAYSSLTNTTSLYFHGFYLSNPRNVNNSLTRGTLQGVDPLIAYLSVADQYMARIGINQVLWPARHLSFSLGGRIEGIPSQDLIGKSEGFRRPGYVVSAEPGLFFQKGNANVFVTVPVALYRNRVKSTYDLADPTGQRHGDAAFADYAINLGFAWRFGGKHSPIPPIQGPLWKEATN